MKKKILKSQNSNLESRKGFTLIELLVAIFIFSLITVAIVSVFVSMATAYGKAKAIKTVKENAEFAMASIAKDVRMGKIETSDANCFGAGTSPKSCLIVTRNRGGKVCYKITSLVLEIDDENGDCTGTMKNLVDLSNLNMSFDTLTSGFYSCPSTFGTPTSCPAGGSSENRRGWVEINLNIKSVAGKEMEADQINVQTIVSSRDYGWEEIQ